MKQGTMQKNVNYSNTEIHSEIISMKRQNVWWCLHVDA